MGRQYKLNEDYFEIIDTEEKAYWLGFIYADGCISEDKYLKIEQKHTNKLYDIV